MPPLPDQIQQRPGHLRKEYYFLQNMFKGFMKSKTSLTRHSKELAMYELSGAYYADWERKN